MIAVGVLLLAGGASAGITMLVGEHHTAKETARNASESTSIAVAPSQDGSLATQSPVEPSPSPSEPLTGPSNAGQVAIASDASQNPDASSVATFLDQYFSAINAHDYQSYVSLLSPQMQQGQTQEQFDHGYRSTADSAETLTSISTAANGDLDVAVTFTSHQNPADSPNQAESCTDWKISLFLEQGGSGYLIDAAPPGYRASYAACP